MKNRRKRIFILGAMLTSLLFSCASIGQYMSISAQEQVIGNVQVIFEAQDTWFTKNAISAQAYIRLLEAAGQKYPGNVDVRDVVWVSGKSIGGPGEQTKEIAATGKVIQIN